MASLTNSLNKNERERLLKQLNTIRKDSDDGRGSISGWLSFLLQQQDEKNRKAEGAELTRGQGRAVLLSEILEAIEGSADQLQLLAVKS